MITDGRFYIGIAGADEGNDKYSKELKDCIEEAGKLCLESVREEAFHPIMMLGNIQSGKTRAFIGLMALCFDNDFDMTIILTKCSKALVQQTVSRMTAEFEAFRTGNATVGDVVAQDILDIDLSHTNTMTEKEAVVRQFLKKYRGKKRIVVVKKQADNVDRVNVFIGELIRQGFYKRILVVDDEADITSVGYEKIKGQEELSLRRISGSINTMRKQMQSQIEHALIQVTATPYALYLQPENFSDSSIMPVKPLKTVVVPTGKGYVGGQYYFVDAEEPEAENFSKAKHLLQIVPQKEMSILNGTQKNSGKNHSITDGRTVRMEDFVDGQKSKNTFVFPLLRKWLFDILVGTAMIQLNPENDGFYVASVMHAATTKTMHKNQRDIIEQACEAILRALEADIDSPDVAHFIEESYVGMEESVRAYGVLSVPSLADVRRKIAVLDESGIIEGLITEVDIKEINSDNDIMTLLNPATGELKLENSITIFIGGQVLDRGITIPNLISFFYGRDPKMMQQDTVMQHCRMFGYRSDMLLSVTRFYTTYRLYDSMKEITLRDAILRNRMMSQQSGNVVYLEAGDHIKACSPQKILASDVHSILPERRYLPVGFEVDKKSAKDMHAAIEDVLRENSAILERQTYRKGDPIMGTYTVVDADTAIDLLRCAYKVLLPEGDGRCNRFEDIEPVFLFSLSTRMKEGNDEIALVVRQGRDLTKTKRLGEMYQDAPDDGNNEGALGQELRKNMPVLMLIEQVNPEWGGKFWWPVYYTPVDMNVGIYAKEQPKSGVAENIFSLSPTPIRIVDFVIENRIDLDENMVQRLASSKNDIMNYYHAQFEPDVISTADDKRKDIVCSVYIDDVCPDGDTEKIEKKLTDSCNEVKNIVVSLGIPESDAGLVKSYFTELVNFNISDEQRDTVIQILDKVKGKRSKCKYLKELLFDAEDLIKSSMETFGWFVTLGSGKCGIHLFYDTVASEFASLGVSEEEKTKRSIEMLEYILAHEMFHALHYAEVMTESGRWLYKNKDVVKQGTVQETLAEYFAFCYAKDIMKKHQLSFDAVEWIRKNRNINDFPRDGGYSGTFILEKKEGVFHKRGKKNALYDSVFIESLRDMPKAYLNIQATKV